MNRYCIRKSYTIKEAIDKIEESHDRVVLVVNDNERIIGVISQGDIIRALSSGKSLYARVEGIIQPDFLYLNDKNMKKAYEMFKKKKITLLPGVDKDYYLKEVITLESIYNYLEGGKDE